MYKTMLSYCLRCKKKNKNKDKNKNYRKEKLKSFKN